jgi:Lon protease-like protein
MLRGVPRERLLDDLPPEKAYRSAAVRVLEDDRSSRPAELGPLHQTLVALCDQLAGALPEGGEALRQLARAYPGAGACADVIAAAVVRDTDLRQGLLEELDPAARLDEVIRYVSALVGQFTRDRSTLN